MFIQTLQGGVPLVEWDFTKGTHGWIGNARVEAAPPTGQGWVVNGIGEDPWIEGPAFQAPSDGLLRVTIEMQTQTDTSAQMFYGRSFSPDRLHSFTVINDGLLHEYSFILPQSTGPGTRLRLDPSHDGSSILLRNIRVEALAKPIPPPFAPPGPVARFESTHVVRAGPLRLLHHPALWNRLRLQWNDRMLAGGYDGELIGIMSGKKVEYLHLKHAQLSVDNGTGLRSQTEVQDSQGGRWKVVRTYKPSSRGNALEVETTISVDKNRQAVLLPWLTLLAGHDSYGNRKHQGLFAGLEYLADEPSSSKADITGPAHLRRVPDPIKITFPLMAIEEAGHYIGITWERSGLLAAGFDSPDRVFGSSGHALWLSGPSVGDLRFENDLVAHSPVPLKANAPMTVRATIIAGESASVMGAVQEYVNRHPLPDLPEYEGGFRGAVNVLAHGWLDSLIHEDGKYKHAEWMGNFKPQPAAGAILFMSWLRRHVAETTLAERLKVRMEQAAAKLNPMDPFASDVSHVRLPATPLVLGRVREYVAQRRSQAWDSLNRFDAEGKVIYRPGRVDYAKTHFANHANGFGAQVLAQSLEAATLCADPELMARLLKLLDQQTMLYARTVPRGAQTWEVPLHTPDILASAHMVRAYVYGHVLSGRQDHLEQARYWAWSGVPFLYLSNPTKGDCGPYATIAVLGATSWQAPVWFGLPVQWCGLVYGSSLHLLSEYDEKGPWKTIAQGITRAGLQMTWPTADEPRQGLLPDFFHLPQQVSDGPAINPGTVGAHLPEAYGRGKMYQFHRFSNGWFMHVPCSIRDVAEDGNQLSFTLDGWGSEPYYLLLSGVLREGIISRISPQPLEISRHEKDNLVVIKLQGRQEMVLRISLGD